MSLRKIFNVIIYILVFSLLAGNGYVLASRLIFQNDLPKAGGFSQLIVISGSMQPALQVGDLIIIKEQNRYQLDDIVTYRTEKSLITHRIVELMDSQAVLQGDANNVPDKAIPVSAIEGKVVLRIPYAGDVLLFARTPRGLSIIILGALVLLNLSKLPKLFKGKVN
ncbi:MAG: signal peptidase I [Clostridia bacterium]|jgi:signal peptidase|nr:signal peptidase I [Clostridia bacterium]